MIAQLGQRQQCALAGSQVGLAEAEVVTSATMTRSIVDPYLQAPLPVPALQVACQYLQGRSVGAYLFRR